MSPDPEPEPEPEPIPTTYNISYRAFSNTMPYPRPASGDPEWQGVVVEQGSSFEKTYATNSAPFDYVFIMQDGENIKDEVWTETDHGASADWPRYTGTISIPEVTSNILVALYSDTTTPPEPPTE